MKKPVIETRTLDCDRRAFLKRSGAALGLMALAGVPSALAEDPTWMAVGAASDFPEGVPIFLKAQKAFVVKTPEGVRALSARCTHRGCTVEASGPEFVCPCHRARFAADGAVVNGPARDPLPALPAKIADGQVWIDASAAR